MTIKEYYQGHWVHLLVRLGHLYFFQPQKTEDLIRKSYDAISENYDVTWTTHMRQFSEEMVQKLPVSKSAFCVDLACGTGFVAGRLADRSASQVIGVDASEGMLQIARSTYGDRCCFVHSDTLDFLRRQPSSSVDVVTCAWGLGYSFPTKVIHQVFRVLTPGGYVGIIDNSIFSISEMVLAALPVLAEKPEAVTHVMNVHFLTGPRSLALRLRLFGCTVVDSWGGTKAFYARSGKEAILRMKATGAAAGFEFSFNPGLYTELEARFARVLEQRYGTTIPIIHRYLAAIGRKKK